jgi:maleate isomerase
MPGHSNEPRIEFDSAHGTKKIGLLVLATDLTSERDFRRLIPPDLASIYVARVPYENPTTPESLRRLLPELEHGTELLLPGIELDVLCFSCTSASVILGDNETAQALQRGKPGTPIVTPPLAVVAALRSLAAKCISILTPYTEETTAPVTAYFRNKGYSISGVTALGLDDDRDMARISPQSLVDIASVAIAEDADALFISCTALRAAEVAVEIKKIIGKPVITSNLASAWMSLRRCGFTSSQTGSGRLMAEFGLPFEGAPE